jgi:hypothetical protein
MGRDGKRRGSQRPRPGSGAPSAPGKRSRARSRQKVADPAGENHPTVSHEVSPPEPPSGRKRTPRQPPAIEGDALPPGLGMLSERLEHMRYLQDFFHNPGRQGDTPIENSSNPEEISRRIDEVQYRINVLKALLVVLNEELDSLNRSPPGGVPPKISSQT